MGRHTLLHHTCCIKSNEHECICGVPAALICEKLVVTIDVSIWIYQFEDTGT